ncbi:dCTP pyrophosphatase 1-like isoform X2 [Tachypleus tridentatus]|uniref:dCTP pyrophosphatase 1-like isoform X2 n=1 Tax=Tachypleus tridentatus TaxID=6853 RepID=UPI003FD38908
MMACGVGVCDSKNSTDEEHFSFSKHPNLEDIRKLQAEFSQERNWDQYHQPRNLLLALMGEVGEVSELFQWRGEVPDGLPGNKDHFELKVV